VSWLHAVSVREASDSAPTARREVVLMRDALLVNEVDMA
jgi:hypothetical protein